ncbi:hypothetical protein BH10BDE1_BH10BDE1_02300 [soil metagenome]
MNSKTTFFLISSIVAFALTILPVLPAQADATEPKGFKFKPVSGEDWPETGDAADGGNRTSTDDDAEGEGRAPASTGGMPPMKMLPDGSIDPDSFKSFF